MKKMLCLLVSLCMFNSTLVSASSLVQNQNDLQIALEKLDKDEVLKAEDELISSRSTLPSLKEEVVSHRLKLGVKGFQKVLKNALDKMSEEKFQRKYGKWASSKEQYVSLITENLERDLPGLVKEIINKGGFKAHLKSSIKKQDNRTPAQAACSLWLVGGGILYLAILLSSFGTGGPGAAVFSGVWGIAIVILPATLMYLNCVDDY